jgi:hypothetical protein
LLRAEAQAADHALVLNARVPNCRGRPFAQSQGETRIIRPRMLSVST